MARLSRSRKLPNMDPQAKRQTCWGMADALMADYHDTEWGVPCRDDAELFERLMLEGFQAGLSWSTILNKRENFREAFEGWDAKRIAEYGEKDLERLMADPGIVRNRLKVAGAVRNARAFLDVQTEHGTFANYIWSFVGGRPIQNRLQNMKQLPATSKESDALSKDLKKRGFKFVGSTIVYAHMQAVGMVNDHLVTCFRHKAVAKLR